MLWVEGFSTNLEFSEKSLPTKLFVELTDGGAAVAVLALLLDVTLSISLNSILLLGCF